MIFACAGCGNQISADLKSCPRCNQLVDPDVAKQRELIKCPDCRGEGEIYRRCDRCDGTGFRPCTACRGRRDINGRKCDICDGSGKVYCVIMACDGGRILEYCETCSFSGYVRKYPDKETAASQPREESSESVQQIKDDGEDLIKKLAEAAAEWDEDFVEKISSIPGVTVSTETTTTRVPHTSVRSKASSGNSFRGSATSTLRKLFKRFRAKLTRLFK